MEVKTDKPQKTKAAPSKKWILVGAVILAVVVAVAVWALWPEPPEQGETLATPTLELAVEGVPGPVDVGVVVSYTEDLNQGAGWDTAGEGVNVAAWRLGLGGVDVRLHLVSDKGSAQGAQDAMAELTSKAVSGVVALTSGSHTDELKLQADLSGLPIVFPYQPYDASAASDGAWYFTPEPEALGRILDQAAQKSECRTSINVHEAGREPLGRSNITTTIQVGQEEAAAVEVARLLEERDGECVVAEANPTTLARLVLALRGRDVDVPVIASSDMLNPAFTKGLGEEAIAVGQLTAPGFASPQTLAMSSGKQGARAGAFIQARDVMSRDANLTSLDGSTPFSETAFFADAASHDALVSVIRAIGAAESTDPADVSEALSGLEMDDQAGLVLGPASFSSSRVAFPDATYVTHSILVNDQLTWFPPEYEDK